MLNWLCSSPPEQQLKRLSATGGNIYISVAHFHLYINIHVISFRISLMQLQSILENTERYCNMGFQHSDTSKPTTEPRVNNPHAVKKMTLYLNTLRPEYNEHHFGDDIWNLICLKYRSCILIPIALNTLRPRQMAAIFQTTFSNAFSWMNMY